MIHILKTLDYVKKCEEDLVQMAMLSRPSFTYEPTAEKIYDQPLLAFMHTRSESALQQQEDATKTETFSKSLEDLQTKCSLEDKTTEIVTGDSSSVSSDKDGSSSESEIQMGPAEKRAARKIHKKKVKEEKREARKTKIPKAEKKRRKKLAKAKCSR